MDSNEALKMYMNAITDMDRYLTKYTAYVNAIYEKNSVRYADKTNEFMARRKFGPELLANQQIAYIGSHAELMNPEYENMLMAFGVISPTNYMPIYQDRFMIPIRNTDGRVINLVGYMWEKDERYVYGTGKYYRRGETFFGLENLGRIMDYGILVWTEGITDTLAIRDIGVWNSLANCGVRLTPQKLKILNRPRYGDIFIPDRDEAGDKTRKELKTNRYVLLNIPLGFKDVDEYMNKTENPELRASRRQQVYEYIKECERWLMQSIQYGKPCGNVEATMGRIG